MARCWRARNWTSVRKSDSVLDANSVDPSGKSTWIAIGAFTFSSPWDETLDYEKSSPGRAWTVGRGQAGTRFIRSYNYPRPSLRHTASFGLVANRSFRTDRNCAHYDGSAYGIVCGDVVALIGARDRIGLSSMDGQTRWEG